MASMANQFDREGRWANLRKAPKSSLQTRVALIVHQRGITKRQMAKFYTLRGKRFDYVAFAKHHCLDWLSLGTLDLHPRIPAPVRKSKSAHSAA